MAHEITEIDGVWQFLHTEGKPGWHGLGTGVTGGISRDDISELLPFACGFSQVPLKVVIDGTSYDVPRKSITFRRGKDGAIYPVDVVGEQFESVGFDRILDFVDTLCSNPGGKNIDTVGLLRDGKTVFLSVPIPTATFEVAGSHDAHEVHLLIRQHASSLALDSMSTSAIRTVCANTEHMALNAAYGKLESKHTLAEQESMLADAKTVLGIVAKDAQDLRDLLKALTKIEPTTEQVDDVLGRLFNSVDGTTNRAQARRDNRKAAILDLAEVGAGNDAKGVRGTAYGLYNGITDYVSHVRGREQDIKAATRLNIPVPNSLKAVQSNLTGSGADILRAAPDTFREVFRVSTN
jgi:phage/plasmid-like protein (TIGR03299 family)